MYTRTVQINGLSRVLTYPEFSQAVADVATWSKPIQFYFHEFKHILTIDVAVDVWGDDQGTIDDFSNTFLGAIARNPNNTGIILAKMDYRDHIGRWVQCERRSLGLNPFG